MVATGRKIVGLEIGLQQAKVVHRRHHHRLGDAFARGELKVVRRLEFRDDDERAGAARDGHDIGGDAGDMREGHGGNRTVVARHLETDFVDHRRMNEIAVRQHRALGLARGARGVEDHGGVLFGDRHGRLRSLGRNQVGERQRSIDRANRDALKQRRDLDRVGDTFG